MIPGVTSAAVSAGVPGGTLTAPRLPIAWIFPFSMRITPSSITVPDTG
jgi:hypothetical protein